MDCETSIRAKQVDDGGKICTSTQSLNQRDRDGAFITIDDFAGSDRLGQSKHFETSVWTTKGHP